MLLLDLNTVDAPVHSPTRSSDPRFIPALNHPNCLFHKHYSHTRYPSSPTPNLIDHHPCLENLPSLSVRFHPPTSVVAPLTADHDTVSAAGMTSALPSQLEAATHCSVSNIRRAARSRAWRSACCSPMPHPAPRLVRRPARPRRTQKGDP